MHSETRRLKLPIDIDDLASAFSQGDLDIQCYLDLKTGRLALITDDVRVALEDIYEALERGIGGGEGIEEEAGKVEEDGEDGEEEDEEECDDDDDEDDDGEEDQDEDDDEEDEDDDEEWSEDQVAAAIDASGSLAAGKEDLLAAHRIEQGSGRYLAVPSIPPSEAYHDMEDFMNTVPSRSLYQRLKVALAGRSPSRPFKDALCDCPEEMSRYSKEIGRRNRERALDWLDDEGIEPVPRQTPPSGDARVHPQSQG